MLLLIITANCNFHYQCSTMLIEHILDNICSVLLMIFKLFLKLARFFRTFSRKLKLSLQNMNSLSYRINFKIKSRSFDTF